MRNRLLPLVTLLVLLLFGCSGDSEGADGSYSCPQQPIGTIEQNTGGTRYTNAAPSNAQSSGPLRARILNVSPLRLEVLNTDLLSGSLTNKSIAKLMSKYTTVSHLDTADEKIRGSIDQLRYGDLVDLFVTYYEYADIELAQGAAITAVKKRAPDAQFAKLLVSYAPESSNGNEFLHVYDDGRLIYKTNMSWVLPGQLTSSELKNLLNVFATSNFDKIPSDFTPDHRKPTVMLSCKRFQPVSIRHHRAQVRPVVAALDELKKRLLDQATLKLGCAKSFEIIDWEYGDLVPLDRIMNTNWRSHAYKTLKSTPVPAKLISQIENGAMFRWKDKLHHIQFGNFDSDHPTARKPPNLNWSQISGGSIRTDLIKPFPMLLIDADQISTEGAAISKPAYFLSRSFYESLPRFPDTGGASLCWQRGNRLFKALYIQVQPAEDELAKLNR